MAGDEGHSPPYLSFLVSLFIFMSFLAQGTILNIVVKTVVWGENG